ncbi:MAG: ABC transporter ATP-binding protein [Pseudomonadota bacterium]|jgi:ABC-2 type transport system ATP-binding protein|nr:ABC transporter ATP-binding protein [Pseudomonadota bacterium]
MSMAVELKGVFSSLGPDFSLGPLNLTIPRGAIYALIGPNGAGKTSTLNLTIGAGRPQTGEIELLGLPFPAREADIKRRIGFVSPELDYSAWRTVGRAIDFVRDFYPDWVHTRCERLQRLLEIHRTQRIAELSFGQRTKLALILALSRECELLILDEPTIGLDPVSKRAIFVELLRFMENESHTILISSHQLGDVERIADHVALLNDGKLLTASPIDELLERYRVVEITNTNAHALPEQGVTVFEQRDARARALLDLHVTTPQLLRANGLDLISITALTLEELFLTLIRSDDARRPWRPY